MATAATATANALGCSIHKNRPVPCRACDCRQDKRIWINFEEQIVSPDFATLFPATEQAALPLKQQT
jgi:hypothetical protein